MNFRFLFFCENKLFLLIYLDIMYKSYTTNVLDSNNINKKSDDDDEMTEDEEENGLKGK